MTIERCESLETKDPTAGIVLTVDQFNHLVEWTQCLYEWGQRVREDIRRLEKATGLSAGDPGDPPLPPWKKKEML